jgi:hypothetical protein
VTDTETLRMLADRQAITDLIYRYCRAMDRIDVELGCRASSESYVTSNLRVRDGEQLKQLIVGGPLHRPTVAV